MHSLSEKEIYDILDQVMVRTAQRMGHVELQEGDTPPSQEVCTVYTQLQGVQGAKLAMCADGGFWRYLAQMILEQEQVSPQDVEDVAKEYFNVVCGMMIARMSSAECRPTRFHIPCFCVGVCGVDTAQGRICIRNYTHDERERVQLILSYSLPTVIETC